MPLRGTQPQKIEKRLKALFYGSAGVGKTIGAISFPAPYLIDTERGSENDQYLKILLQRGGVIFQTTDMDEIMQEVKCLLSEEHPYKTLIIDPLTVVYSALLDESEKKVGADYGRHYIDANKKIKHLLALLLKLDMNIIITSHAKTEYGSKMELLGQTFDCYKKLDYLFDLVIEIQKRGKERFAIVKKSRIKGFNEADSFEFSYTAVAERYGKEILEKGCAPKEMASEDSMKELKRLVELLKVPAEIVDKWLKKAGANELSEMEQSQIEACIEMLKNKIEEK